MNIRPYTSIFLMFTGFVLLQIILFGLVDFGPLLFISIYPLFLLTLPLYLPSGRLMVWAFATGLTIDYFSNSIMGINSAASIIMVVSQTRVFKLLYRKGDLENQVRPGMGKMGLSRFSAYIAINPAIHHIVLVSLENFGFGHFASTLPRIVVSLMANTILILIADYGVFYRRRR